jgi:large subunit ribosomal protein L16
MLMPKRVKWRKQMRGRMKGKAYRGAEVSFGEYGLQALEPGWVTARQIEAARRAIVREMKRRGKVWIRIFPAKPYTHKPPETRMGSGKGNVEYYVAVVKPGRIMFEISGLPEDMANQALKSAQYKLAIRTKIVARHEAGE